MKLNISISVDQDDERLKRARSQGYDTTKVWYHGSAKTFTEYNLKADRVNRGLNIEGKGDSFVPFTPNQIKLVIGNSGTFSKTNDSIFE